MYIYIYISNIYIIYQIYYILYTIYYSYTIDILFIYY